MAELEEREEDRESPFHPDNVHQYTLLTLFQIRELLAGILKEVNPSGYEQVRGNHREGALSLELPFVRPPGEGGVE